MIKLYRTSMYTDSTGLSTFLTRLSSPGTGGRGPLHSLSSCFRIPDGWPLMPL